MAIDNDEQIHTQGDQDNDDIHASIMQSSDCEGEISVWKLEFDSEEHAYQWYNEYAREVGFSIRKQWKNWDRFSGVISSRRFVCYKEGFRKIDKRTDVKKPRKETRTGCLAGLTIALQASGKYRAIDFESNHNHELASKSCVHMLPSQRIITDVQAIEIELADNSGIQPKLAHELMSRQVGGRENLGFTKQDQKNYLRSKRKIDLKQGEAGSLLNFFLSQVSENPSFFFRVQMDVEDQITNIFWADAKMILDYGIFGDVVFFDTTYRTNKECRPFGAFVGLNHHYQQVVFGASLLYDETSQSFEWLFHTFLECMSGKKPKTIFTDRDPAMAKAIPLVMPETYHRLCLWHLYQNALKNLNHLFKSQKTFNADFSSCIYDGEYEEEFISAWENLLQKYGLQENAWLQDLFKVREKWAMVYGRNTFSAGKKSTQLSESFNSHLRDYLKSDLDLVQFFKHFQRAVDDLRYNEVCANYDMSQKIPTLKVNVPLLRHARDIYTGAIFIMFQDEFEKSLMVVVDTFHQSGPVSVYKVHNCEDSRQHTVTSSNGLITCSCKKIEFVGIMCSHILKVLDEMKIKMMIPEQFILKRWTKNARAGIVLDIHECEVQNDPKLEMRARYRNLCTTYVRLVGKAAESKEACDFLASHASELYAKVEEYLKVESPSETLMPSSIACDKNKQDIALEKNVVKSTMTIQAKGLKKREVSRGRKRHRSCLENRPKKRSKTIQTLASGVTSPTTCVPPL
jgi:zinc finger SWIM domain-containing protein 3